jgi:hypothetical protein
MAIIKKSIASNKTKCHNPKKIGYPPKLTKVNIKIKVIILLFSSLNNNSKLLVENENLMNTTITSNSDKNPRKQNKASKLENI